MKAFERSRESPMDWEGERDARPPPWAAPQKRDMAAFKEDGSVSGSQPSSTSLPVHSNQPFLFNLPPPPPSTSLANDVEMADSSLVGDRSLVLARPSEEARTSRVPLEAHKHSSSWADEPENHSDETQVKHRGSDEDHTTAHSSRRVFAKGAVHRTRRQRLSQRRSGGRRGNQLSGRRDSEDESDDHGSGHHAASWPRKVSSAVNYFAPIAPPGAQELSHLDWPEILLGWVDPTFVSSLAEHLILADTPNSSSMRAF